MARTSYISQGSFCTESVMTNNSCPEFEMVTRDCVNAHRSSCKHEVKNSYNQSGFPKTLDVQVVMYVDESNLLLHAEYGTNNADHELRLLKHWGQVSGLAQDSFRGLLHNTHPDILSRDNKQHKGTLGLTSIRLLQDPTSSLDDNCMNDCARFLRDINQSEQESRCALFLTYHAEWAADINASGSLFRSLQQRQYYQERDIWFIPIFHAGHWTLVVAFIVDGVLLQFDSLAEEKRWHHDIEASAKLILQVSILCSINIHQEWKACSLMTTRAQSNFYDSGLWVLAEISAVFRGFDITDLREEDMRGFRKYLLHLSEQ